MRVAAAVRGRVSRPGLNPALLLWAFVLIFAVGVVLEPLLRLMPELSLEVGRGFWTILSLVIFAPIFEELICRGVVLGSLRGKFGVTTAWLVSSLFFGVLHGQPVQVINATVIGLVLGYVYLATDSLWSVMILHALNNAVAYLALAIRARQCAADRSGGQPDALRSDLHRGAGALRRVGLYDGAHAAAHEGGGEKSVRGVIIRR